MCKKFFEPYQWVLNPREVEDLDVEDWNQGYSSPHSKFTLNFTWVRTGIFTALDYFVLICPCPYNLSSGSSDGLIRKLGFDDYLLLFGKSMLLKSTLNAFTDFSDFINSLAHFVRLKTSSQSVLHFHAKGYVPFISHPPFSTTCALLIQE